MSNSVSLRRKTINSAFWTTTGHVSGQLLRFGSNLILTRMLAPEYYGVMALVNVFLVGLTMFSDIGLGPNVIQSPRSKEPEFLNITWTIQILRGIALWIITAILAYPFATFYNEPTLAYVLPVAGLTPLILGFTSTNLITNNRDLNMFKLSALDITTQVTAILSMIFIAKLSPSVWVLVLGSLIGSLSKVVLSHLWLSGIRNQLKWEKETVKELINFGKWIFFSSLLTFTGNNIANLTLGKLVSMSEMGVFAIAMTLAKTIEAVYNQISNKVLFPIYNLIKNESPEEIRIKVKKIRTFILCLFLPALWILIIFGDQIIQILFDDRYQGAGWILKIFAFGLIPTITSGIGPFYLALGDSKQLLKVSVLKLVSSSACIYLGWYLLDVEGVMWGIAGSSTILYIYDITIQRRHKIWVPAIDIISFIASTVILGSALYIQLIL